MPATDVQFGEMVRRMAVVTAKRTMRPTGIYCRGFLSSSVMIEATSFSVGRRSRAISLLMRTRRRSDAGELNFPPLETAKPWTAAA